jgi:hypothetical protein
MTEESVTKKILFWLESQGWNIVAFDFPQSGTGVILHSNSPNRTGKNKGSFIPDIIAVKFNVAVLFENKNRFVKSDFIKLNSIKVNETHSEAIWETLAPCGISTLLFGIAMPHSIANIQKAIPCFDLVDFVICLSECDPCINVAFDKNMIFS